MSKNKNLDITSFTILHDNVLVQAIEITERDGIVKPSSYEDKPELGKVLAVGSGRQLESGEVVALKVKPGQIALFNEYSATKINLEGTDFYIIREEDIIAVK